VTHLRQLMIEELPRRNFADSTIRSYIHGVEHFSQVTNLHDQIYIIENESVIHTVALIPGLGFEDGARYEHLGLALHSAAVNLFGGGYNE
jgi:hypothetical protein